MSEQQELTFTPAAEVAGPAVAEHRPEEVAQVQEVPGAGGALAERWQAEAGRKGARRVHQLIREGRLYEQEHGLKRGRQRLRQLIELGKLYEQEHGLRPARKKHADRLSRADRAELLATLLQCLVRLAKPSFRAELLRLAESLSKVASDQAA
ncbi:MAG TPA: hypothetical protein VFE78_09385 [Gemmataceae bacterium]|jgi:hypothetical protein|nr:hypothetical protein [Gemmataceae bacterium]